MNIPAHQNPFRAARIEKLAYLGTESVQEIASRFAANSFRGAIVGPHGSGKTTLLEAIAEHLPSFGRKVAWLRLYDEVAVDVPKILSATAPLQENAVLLVDGGEVLLRNHISRLMRTVGRAGLLVTAHSDVPVPVLVRTSPDERLLLALLRQLVPDQMEQYESAALNLFERYSGNVRAVFRDLYDMAAGIGLAHQRIDEFGFRTNPH